MGSGEYEAGVNLKATEHDLENIDLLIIDCFETG